MIQKFYIYVFNQRKWKHLPRTDTCNTNVHCSVTYNSQDTETCYGWMNKENVYTQTHTHTQTGHKKRRKSCRSWHGCPLRALCSMKSSQRKTNIELYDFTSMWNIKKKTPKHYHSSSATEKTLVVARDGEWVKWVKWVKGINSQLQNQVLGMWYTTWWQ